ncbi:MAG: class I SAM-dependent methyltransferase [Minisyncoccota bacterium]
MRLNNHSNSIKNIYENHHFNKERGGFSILEKERGELLKECIGTGKTVLDIGCRDGWLTKHYVVGNDVLGVDIDGNLLKNAQQNLKIQTLLMDLNSNWDELGDRKSNVIVAGEVLEHLYYPEIVLEKVKNHLSPGGIFIGSVPNAFSLKNRLRYLFGKKKNTPLEDPTHINQFSYKEIENLLKSSFSGVKIIGLGRAGFLAKFCPNLFAFDLFFVCKND